MGKYNIWENNALIGICLKPYKMHKMAENIKCKNVTQGFTVFVNCADNSWKITESTQLKKVKNVSV
jgi:YbbR domain-containing protein